MKKGILTLFVILLTVFVTNALAYRTKIDLLIQKVLQLNRFNGSVLVSKNGKIVYKKAEVN